MSITRVIRLALLSSCIAAMPGTSSAAEDAKAGTATVKWDEFGVPHILAADEEALFYAFGWCQMHSHANLVLSLYGSARGQAAEYWGDSHLGADALIRALQIPQMAARAYKQQDPDFKRYIDVFVKGMNDYARAHPQAVKDENQDVLPVQPSDLFANLLRTMELGFVGRRILVSGSMEVPAASNALALSPARTVEGNAMLLTNPHLPWRDFYTFYEAHLKLGDRNFYGATLMGFPVLVLAFNDRLGWAHTANYVDGADLYEITMTDEDHYLYDGQSKALEKKTQTLLVKDGEGGRESRELTLSYAVQGPVVLRRGDKAYAYRSTRGLYPRLFQQYWKMIQASSLEEFQAALEMMQAPFFNVIYADQDGHTMFMWNGLLPERSVGDAAFWLNTIPGNKSETMWSETYGFQRLPRFVDPPSGWLQNSNDLPWTSTLPAQLEAGDYPPFIPPAEIPGLRTQQLIKTLQTAPKQSFESLREMKFLDRVEMADRILDDLFEAIDSAPREGEEREVLEQCKRVLESWDRRVDADSKGAVLFRAWVRRLGEEIFAQGFDAGEPLSTPRGLKDPPGALKKLLESAHDVTRYYGSLDVAWGEVHRFKVGTEEYPGNGGPGFMGIFHSIQFAPGQDGKFYSRGGESYSALVEFSKPVRAEVLLAYGNSSQEGSPHNGDQLSLLASKSMREALLSVEQIDKHLSRQEKLSVGK
ncbi:MAG TPA: penicillin acylase family protein [Acidobacteriota bacterium]|nr:penicillin acylase family protein [Acidobacteriota bacterium]